MDGLHMWDGMRDTEIAVVTQMLGAGNDAGWNGLAAGGVCFLATVGPDGKPTCYGAGIEPWCVTVGPNCLSARNYPNCLARCPQ